MSDGQRDSRDSDDRREFDRRLMRIEALVVTINEDDGHSTVATSQDISVDGIRVETEQAVAVGDTLKLLMSDRRSATVVRVTAKVVHVEQGSFGAKFIHHSERGKENMRAFVQRLLKSRER